MKWMNRQITICLMLLLIVLIATGCVKKTPEAISMNNYFLDTICNVSIYEMENGVTGDATPARDCQEIAEDTIKGAFALCAELDKKLSKTIETSDIYKVNHANGEWVEVSDDTITIVRNACDWSTVSDGDFDITIGSVTALWDFHAEPDEGKLPDDDELSEAVSHVGYNNIEIDGNMLRLRDPETKLDLGGIAKGYIGDCMADYLVTAGVTSGIVNLGGNVICIGARDNEAASSVEVASARDIEGDEAEAEAKAKASSKEAWFKIGIEAPYTDRREIVGMVFAKDMTLVTSGIYERQIEVDGELYHHILNPKTGYPAESDLIAVSLIAPRGISMDVDALSTICLIKGYEEAYALITSLNQARLGETYDGRNLIEAVFILKDGTIRQTEGAELQME